MTDEELRADQERRIAEHKRWVAEVRDPAEAGKHVLFAFGTRDSTVRLEIAEVAGGWTWRGQFWNDRALTGGASPWCDPLPSRAAAEDAAYSYLRRDADRPGAPWPELAAALPAEGQGVLL